MAKDEIEIFEGKRDDDWHRWMGSSGQVIKDRRTHNPSHVVGATAKQRHTASDFLKKGFNTATQASTRATLGKDLMDIGLVDTVVLAKHCDILKMLFEEPRSDAGEYRNSPWKVIALLQNLQTYDMWIVMRHHLFRILAHRDADGAIPNNLDVFVIDLQAWNGEDHVQLAERLMIKLRALVRHEASAVQEDPDCVLLHEPVMEAAEAMKAHLVVAARLSTKDGVIANHGLGCFQSPHATFFLGLMRMEPIYGKAVSESMTAIHECMDLFCDRLFMHGKALADNVRLVCHIKGLASVLVMVQNAQGDVAPPPRAKGGDRYEIGATLAAINCLHNSLAGQQKDLAEQKRNLRNLLKRNRTPNPNTKGADKGKGGQKRPRDASEVPGIELSENDDIRAAREAYHNVIRCHNCKQRGHFRKSCPEKQQ
ncbi:hypothetical protein SARC_09609 [Sphaeroforma arctica JP610]|uniref:CCHC-type domain-containing protein n=1 Tax=Sphaeroforma arctica JP610 TaxID=667725 RepID=A0A0L0FME4_9EUKA|nr:hypothetical protein SARC_09609 [Sphaeroforma arctica JP610]KNC77944.1 hypothetical protein SARC_09609 [Sphaeroforma arctica JP610]|eukprot:XP_014151846.1 hypothetical protein SARC_09609 [Sphaeroforma arctica JP610]